MNVCSQFTCVGCAFRYMLLLYRVLGNKPKMIRELAKVLLENKIPYCAVRVDSSYRHFLERVRSRVVSFNTKTGFLLIDIRHSHDR